MSCDCSSFYPSFFEPELDLEYFKPFKDFTKLRRNEKHEDIKQGKTEAKRGVQRFVPTTLESVETFEQMQQRFRGNLAQRWKQRGKRSNYTGW